MVDALNQFLYDQVLAALTVVYHKEAAGRSVLDRVLAPPCRGAPPRCRDEDLDVVCRVLKISHPPGTHWTIRLAEVKHALKQSVFNQVVAPLAVVYGNVADGRLIFHRMLASTCRTVPRCRDDDLELVCDVLGFTHPSGTPWQVRLASVQAWYKLTRRLEGESAELQLERQRNIDGLRMSVVLDKEVRRLLSQCA